MLHVEKKKKKDMIIYNIVGVNRMYDSLKYQIMLFRTILLCTTRCENGGNLLFHERPGCGATCYQTAHTTRAVHV